MGHKRTAVATRHLFALDQCRVSRTLHGFVPFGRAHSTFPSVESRAERLAFWFGNGAHGLLFGVFDNGFDCKCTEFHVLGVVDEKSA